MPAIEDTGGISTLNGTNNNDTFRISQEFGQRTINAFDVDNDKVDLAAYGSDLTIDVTQKGDHVIVNLTQFENGNIILKDVDVDDLDVDNFDGVTSLNVVDADDVVWDIVVDRVWEGTDDYDDQVEFHRWPQNDLGHGRGYGDQLWTWDGDDIVFGGNGDDDIHGEAGSDIIYGGAGNDTLLGGGIGAYDLWGTSEGTNELHGGAGNDGLYGGLGDDILYGDTGNDTLVGDYHKHSLDAEGDDILDGGSGTNTLSGKGGADTFVYVMSNEGIDTITDFSSEDTLDIQGFTGTELVMAEVGNDVVINMTDNGGTAGSITLLNTTIDGLEASQFTGVDTLKNVIDNGGGLTILTGTSANDVFVIDTQFGQRVIKDFDTENDEVDLSAYSAYQDADGNLTLDITQKGADVVINTTPFDNGNIVLKDIDVDDLTVANFKGVTSLNVVDAGDVHWDIIAKNLIVGTHNSEDFGDIPDTDGTNQNDLMMFTGRAHDDISGLDGDDIIHGGWGWDWIWAGNGNDIVYAGDDGGYSVSVWAGGGHDTIYGAGGDDGLYGGVGDDVIYGRGGDDIIDGGDGHDKLVGDDGADTISGDGGDDVLDGGAGDDHVTGNGGDDTMTGGAGSDKFSCQIPTYGSYASGPIGNDIITDFDVEEDTFSIQHVEIRDHGYYSVTVITDLAVPELRMTQVGSDVVVDLSKWGGTVTIKNVNFEDLSLSNFVKVDSIVLDDGTPPVEPIEPIEPIDLTIDGTNGNDILTGGEGDDVVRGYAGEDIISTGAGNDTVNGGNGIDTIYGGDGDDLLKGGEENVGGDYIYGETGNDLLNGGGGDDTLYGGAGDDNLKGYSDNDTLYGGAGNDILGGRYGNAGAGNDAMYGGDGNDSVDGGVGDDTVSGGSGTNNVSGGSGTDTFVYVMSEDGVDIFTDFSNQDIVDIQGLVGTELTLKEVGNDTVIDMTDNGGTAGSITLKDVALSSLSASQFVGVDTLLEDGAPVPTPPQDLRLNGTSGNDTLTGGAGDDTIWGYDGEDTLHGEAGDDFIHGNDGADIIYAGDGDDRVKGGEETTGDIIYGEGGDDWLNGGGGNDTMYGGEGSDVVWGFFGDDVLHGGAGDDEVGRNYGNGGIGNDTLYGDAGDDMLFGGVGTNTLTGGSGFDTFVYNASQTGHDTITDFAVGEDVIQLHGFGLDYAELSALFETNVDGDAVVHLPHPSNSSLDATITLTDVAIADLSVGDFLL